VLRSRHHWLRSSLIGSAGALYAGVALAGGILMIVLAWQLRSAGDARRTVANRLFAFSIVYLAVLFAAQLLGKFGIA